MLIRDYKAAAGDLDITVTAEPQNVRASTAAAGVSGWAARSARPAPTRKPWASTRTTSQPRRDSTASAASSGRASTDDTSAIRKKNFAKSCFEMLNISSSQTESGPANPKPVPLREPALARRLRNEGPRNVLRAKSIEVDVPAAGDARQHSTRWRAQINAHQRRSARAVIGAMGSARHLTRRISSSEPELILHH